MFAQTDNRLTFGAPSGAMRSPVLSRNASRACMTAETMAWAVTHNIPITDALRALPFYWPFAAVGWTRWPRFSAFMKELFIPFRPLHWLVNIRWSWHLVLFLRELEKGEPLAYALEKRLSMYFPSFYIMGVIKAERDNMLETALPTLARQMRFPESVFMERKMHLIYVAAKGLIMTGCLLFMAFLIFPVMEAMRADLLRIGTDTHSAIGAFTRNAIGVGTLLTIILVVLVRFSIIGEQVLLSIPFLGREKRRFLISDLARSMAAFLRQGEDVLSAAQWSQKTTKSEWIRRRLDVFVTGVSRGTGWAQAWSDMHIGTPLHDWLIGNAALREDPASVFELLTDLLEDEIRLTSRRMSRWLDPCCAVIFGLIVIGAAYFIYVSLLYLPVSAMNR